MISKFAEGKHSRKEFIATYRTWGLLILCVFSIIDSFSYKFNKSEIRREWKYT